MAWGRNGQGDFTRFGTSVLATSKEFANEGFQKAVAAAFGPNPAQHPYLDCTDEARTEPLLTPWAGGST